MATIRQRDPTMTTGLRGRYTAEMRRRMRRIKALVLESVVVHDALRLKQTAPVSPGVLFGAAQAAGRYDFPSDIPGKAAAFMAWLRKAIEDELLGIVQGDVRNVVSRDGWQDVYVRAAYGAGLAAADAALKRLGLDVPDLSISAAFNLPVHADTLAILFSRNFEELKGVSEAMATQISRALSEGLAQGLGPREIGKLMGDAIDGLTRTRGELISRTEIIRAWNESALNRYEQFGIPGVTAQVEFATAGDDNVCKVCKGLAKQDNGHGPGIFTLAEARGVIPVHPRCRCAWLPVVAGLQANQILAVFSGVVMARRGVRLRR